MITGWDFGQSPTIYYYVPDDMRRASDICCVENLTCPHDSISSNVMETNPKRVEPDWYHTRVKPQTWSPGEVSGAFRRTAHRPCLTRRHIPDIIHESTNDCR